MKTYYLLLAGTLLLSLYPMGMLAQTTQPSPQTEAKNETRKPTDEYYAISKASREIRFSARSISEKLEAYKNVQDQYKKLLESYTAKEWEPHQYLFRSAAWNIYVYPDYMDYKLRSEALDQDAARYLLMNTQQVQQMQTDIQQLIEAKEQYLASNKRYPDLIYAAALKTGFHQSQAEALKNHVLEANSTIPQKTQKDIQRFIKLHKSIKFLLKHSEHIEHQPVRGLFLNDKDLNLQYIRLLQDYWPLLYHEVVIPARPMVFGHGNPETDESTPPAPQGKIPDPQLKQQLIQKANKSRIVLLEFLFTSFFKKSHDVPKLFDDLKSTSSYLLAYNGDPELNKLYREFFALQFIYGFTRNKHAKTYNIPLALTAATWDKAINQKPSQVSRSIFFMHILINDINTAIEAYQSAPALYHKELLSSGFTKIEAKKAANSFKQILLTPYFLRLATQRREQAKYALQAWSAVQRYQQSEDEAVRKAAKLDWTENYKQWKKLTSKEEDLKTLYEQHIIPALTNSSAAKNNPMELGPGEEWVSSPLDYRVNRMLLAPLLLEEAPEKWEQLNVDLLEALEQLKDHNNIDSKVNQYYLTRSYLIALKHYSNQGLWKMKSFHQHIESMSPEEFEKLDKEDQQAFFRNIASTRSALIWARSHFHSSLTTYAKERAHSLDNPKFENFILNHIYKAPKAELYFNTITSYDKLFDIYKHLHARKRPEILLGKTQPAPRSMEEFTKAYKLELKQLEEYRRSIRDLDVLKGPSKRKIPARGNPLSP